jgi:hydrogenase maturation protease
MKPQLVIGLGNPLMGDDGVGCAVAERLADDPRLPESVEVICGGTDLLRCFRQMEGRSRVIIIDAIQDDAEPGSVVSLEEAAIGVDARQKHVHHLSAVQSMQLLQMTMPACFLLLGVSISAAGVTSGLSPELASRLPAILDRVFHALARS